MKERLQKIIAQAGLASRRKAEEWIVQGRVTVNGTVTTELGTKADPGDDVIQVNGIQIGPSENKVYIALHKPYGYISSTTDPQGRPTVTSLIKKDIAERMFPVGRLDFDTEGLLLLTNDGAFSQALLHPKSRVPRTYQVKVKGIPPQKAIDRLEKGIVIDGAKTWRANIRITGKTKNNSWLEVVLWEGRNRQIKKMFEAVGTRVLRIIRTAFGPVSLDDLKAGTYRYLQKREIKEIKKLATSQK